jgi:molecular chaperone GrpE
MSGNPRYDNRREDSAAPDADDWQGEESPEERAAGGPGGGTPSPLDEEALADPQAACEAEKARADENWERYLRAAAELDNVRKRAARDVENARKFAIERFATELLAVKDSLEMGLAAAAENTDVDSLLEGSRTTLKQLASALERFGIEEVDPEGEPFDPHLHEAMTTQPSAEVEPDTVLTVYQKGYTLNGRLLRPARVVVAAAADRG